MPSARETKSCTESLIPSIASTGISVYKYKESILMSKRHMYGVSSVSLGALAWHMTVELANMQCPLFIRPQCR